MICKTFINLPGILLLLILMSYTKILIAQESPDSSWKYYSNIEALDGLQTDPGQLSKDGLEYYVPILGYSDDHYSSKGFRIFVLKRNHPEEHFGSPQILQGLPDDSLISNVSPTTTYDKKILIFLRHNVGFTTKWSKLYMAVRSDPDSAFESVQELNQLNTKKINRSPWISPNGLTLYFLRNNSFVYKSTRNSVVDSFGSPDSMFFDKAWDIWFSANELEIYYTKQTGVFGIPDLYYASRHSANKSFSNMVDVPWLAGGHLGVYSPSLFRNEFIIWFHDDRFSGEAWVFRKEIVNTLNNNEYYPKVFLSQNYPNPFNPETIINYQLPMTSYVELSVFNILGQKVATLVSGKQISGTHQVNFNATGLASGIYYYMLKAGNLISHRKMILLK